VFAEPNVMPSPTNTALPNSPCLALSSMRGIGSALSQLLVVFMNEDYFLIQRNLDVERLLTAPACCGVRFVTAFLVVQRNKQDRVIATRTVDRRIVAKCVTG
jgi:hypothetical protein